MKMSLYLFVFFPVSPASAYVGVRAHLHMFALSSKLNECARISEEGRKQAESRRRDQ